MTHPDPPYTLYTPSTHPLHPPPFHTGHVTITVIPWSATQHTHILGTTTVALHVAANSSACVWEGKVGDLVTAPGAAGSGIGADNAFVLLNMAPGVEDTGQSLMRLHLQVCV